MENLTVLDYLEKYKKYEDYEECKIRELKYISAIFFILTIFFYIASFVINENKILFIAVTFSIVYFFKFKKYLAERIFVSLQKCDPESDKAILSKLEECYNALTIEESEKLFKDAKEFYIQNYFNFSVSINLYAREQLDNLESNFESNLENI